MTTTEPAGRPNPERLLVAALGDLPGATLADAARDVGAGSGLGPAVDVALRRLARHRDPAGALAEPQYRPARMVLAEVLSDECLHALRELLGDAADDPDRDQLVAALGEAVPRFPLPVLRLTLALVANAEAPASRLCAELLTGDDPWRLELPPEVPARPDPVPSPPGRPPAPARAERRRPKAKPAPRPGAPPRYRKQRPAGPPPPAAGDPPPPAVGSVVRRVPPLSDRHRRRFAVDDPLVGTVVSAEIWFDEDGPVPGAKWRPCVVVGVAPAQLLVRPCYSGEYQQRRWKAHPLRDWRGAGLRGPTWVEEQVRSVGRAVVSPPLGRLSDEDWNSLW